MHCPFSAAGLMTLPGSGPERGSHDQPHRDLDLAVCLNAYSGYPLDLALDQVRDVVGWQAVELDAIAGLFSHIDLDRAEDASYRNQVVALFNQRQLSCRAVSAQRPAVADMAPADVTRMSALMELTAELGAARINLGAGADEEGFRRNIDPLLRVAAALDVSIGLETQGPAQLVHGPSCAQLLASISSDRLDVNYDFGNGYFATNGTLDMLADFLTMQSLVKVSQSRSPTRLISAAAMC